MQIKKHDKSHMVELRDGSAYFHPTFVLVLRRPRPSRPDCAAWNRQCSIVDFGDRALPASMRNLQYLADRRREASGKPISNAAPIA
jgi:hypothetical protein